jgi:flagellar biosynthetic protein FliR
MPPSIDLYLAHLATFALVLVRVGVLLAVAPVFGALAVPLRVRAAVALALVVLIVPLEVSRATAAPALSLGFLIALCGEALVGLVLGLGVRILFVGMHLAGQIISQLGGMQLSEVVSPGSGAPVPLVSHLYLIVTSAVFVVIGGHRRVIEALLDTFAWLPAGQGALSHSAVEAVTALVAHSFVLGVRAAAPVMVALLLSTLIVGLVSRALPQLNVLSLGFGINALVAMAAIGVSLGGACWVFQDQIEPVLETALHALRPI